MISMPLPLPARPVNLSFAHSRFSSLLRNAGKLAAACAVFAVLLCGADRAAAQISARFTSSQIVLEGGFGFGQVQDVAVDSSGNLYIADLYGAIYKIPTGCTTASCVQALVSGYGNPEAVAVDGSGNVFVADRGIPAVYEIPFNGTSYGSRILLGSGFNYVYPFGVAVDSNGNVYFADAGLGAVEEMSPNCTSSTCITRLGGTFGFNGPQGVAVDGSGNVYIADFFSNAVEKMSPNCTSSTCVTTLGSGFDRPTEVQVDSSGNVYVSVCGINCGSSSGGSVQEILAAGGYTTVNTLGSGFDQPYGVAVDGSGNVFVADQGLNKIVKISPAAGNFYSQNVGSTSSSIVTLNFTFTAGIGSIRAPLVFTQGAVNKDFTDAGTGTCTTNGTGYTYSGGSTCTVNVKFTPKAAGTRYGAVVLEDSSGITLATGYVQGTGTGPQVDFSLVSGASPSLLSSPATPQSTLGSGFLHPTDVAVDASGNVYVADYGDVNNNGANSAVYEIPAGNGTPRALGSGFSEPIGVAVDGAGNVYVGDTGNGAVKEILAVNGSIPASPTIVTLGGNFDFISPKGVAVDASGNVYVGDDFTSAVYEMSPNCRSSACVTTLGGSFFNPNTNAPQGVAVDGSGNVYVADYYAAEVFEMSPNCLSSACVTTLGSSLFNDNVNDPIAVAVDGVGNVYVADIGTDAVYEILAVNGSIPASPTINTLATGFVFPQGVAVDSRGNVYVADSSTVDELDYADAPSLSFATATELGTTDATDGPKTVTVQNVGNAALTFTVPGTGSNPSYAAGFPENTGDTNLCASGTPLAAGSSCDVSADFQPTGVGTNSGSVVLTDNALNVTNTTQTIALSGTGVDLPTQLAITSPPTAAIQAGGNAGSITVAEEDPLGAVVTAAGDTITLTVTGPNSYSATHSATASGGVATFNLSAVALTAAGSYTYTATSGSLTQVTATETVVASQVNLSSSENVGSSTSAQAVTVYIAAAGTPSTINVLTQGASGLDFTQAASPNGGTCSTSTAYTVGQTCTVNVIFTPKHPGQRLGAVVLTNSSGTVLGRVLLQGTGTGPQVTFPSNSTVNTVGNGFAGPYGVAVDAAGDVFVAAIGNSWVNEIVAVNGQVSSNSTVLTVGNGFSQPSGVAVDGAGDVLVADSSNSTVKEIVAVNGAVSSGSTVLTVGSGFSYPFGVAVDGAGDVFVADSGNLAVMEIVAVNGAVSSSSTVIPVGSGFSTPSGVAVDAAGDVFVADESTGAVYEILAGTGGAASGQVSSGSTTIPVGSGFHIPTGVAVDGAGNVFVADSFITAVKEIVSGTGGAASGQVSSNSTVNALGSGFSSPRAWRWTGPATSSSLISATALRRSFPWRLRPA